MMANDLSASKTGHQLPKNMGDLLLFDAINGDGQIPTVNNTSKALQRRCRQPGRVGREGRTRPGTNGLPREQFPLPRHLHQ